MTLQIFFKLKECNLFYPVVLILIVFSVLYPVLGNDFLHFWDDQWMVMNDYTQGGITWYNIKAIFLEYYNGQYGPVNQYLYLIIYNFVGYNPFFFHLVSLLIHIMSTILVYFTIIKISNTTTRMNMENKRDIAFFTALIFAIHPMNVEAVAWISAVKIINYAFFYLLSTYVYIIFLEKKQFTYYLLSVVLFILSFGGKEQAVTFPVWLVMLYWILGYNLKDKKVWFQVGLFFLLAFFFGIVTILSQSDIEVGLFSGKYVSYPLWQRFILGCYSFFEYITKLILPYNLLYIYPFPVVLGEPVPTWMLVYPSLLVIIVLTLWRYLIKWPVTCGVIFFIIHIVITLHLIPLSRFAVIADRYVYISSIGFAFIIAYYMVYYYKHFGRKSRILLMTLFSFLVLGWGIYSNLRAREWYNSDTIKKDLNELLKQRTDFFPEEI
ncbi:MAG: hypothetical protein LUH10_07605 [Tannerellaceae bacterium]|nr:hypothetical protein [Tannerellaceae bacterium]